jgi:putative peptide zinc metalloprotease protein
MQIYPKLRPDLVESEHLESGGDRVVILKDPVSEKFFRLSPFEYDLLRKFDGSRSVEQAAEAFQSTGRYCTKEEVNLVLGKAAQLGLVLGTKFGVAESQRALRERLQKAKRAQRYSSVYFLFIPLINPDRFLERTVGFFRAVVNRWTAGLVAALLPGAVYLVISGWTRIQNEYLFFFNLENLLYLWATIAIAKLCHEMAHAYTAKNFGLRVPQMGVGFLIFFPCLYCNTTEAWSLADRRQRMAISAAGILAEAVLAIVSAYIWAYTKPGVLNSLAFYLMAVSFASTVLFNGNPLMKFDGYFILMDYIGIPNLRNKSLSYLRYLFMNRVMGVDAVAAPPTKGREGAILSVYGVAAFAYLVFLYVGIIAGVYYRFDKTLGIFLALLAAALFVVKPLAKGGASLYRARSSLRPRLKGGVIFLALVIAGLAPLVIPLSSRSMYPCTVASFRVQKLTVPLQTYVAKVYVDQWSDVTAGTPLFELDSSQLKLALLKKRLQRDIVMRQMETMRLDPKERGRVAGKTSELYHIDYELARIEKDLDTAKGGVKAPFDGVITSLDHRMQYGFRPGEGMIVGELQSPDHCLVKALVPEQDLGKVSPGQEVEIWLPIRGGLTIHSKINSIKSFGEADLTDSPLSSRFGGQLATEVRGERRKDAPLIAQYECSVVFTNPRRVVPLGMVGQLVVSSPPRSILSVFVDDVVRTFGKEIMF